jgi:hypothetical protein
MRLLTNCVIPLGGFTDSALEIPFARRGPFSLTGTVEVVTIVKVNINE